MDKIDLTYLKYTRGQFTPHIYQKRIFKHLAKGHSVAAVLPTGSGKTESVLFPFLEHGGKTLPNKMVIGLPLRSLVDSIGNRCKEYAEVANKKAHILHGQNTENPLFLEHITASTVDQLFCGYLGIPLSESINNGNITAGALLSSFCVFDEAHLLSEKEGFQSLLRLLQVYNELDIPVCIMSATLPKNFLKYLKEKYKYKIVVTDDETKIPSRRKRKTYVQYFDKKKLCISDIIRIYKRKEKGNIIVLVNTVDKSLEIYKGLCDALGSTDNVLLNSRFTSEDRGDKESFISDYFGKNAKFTEKKILVTTQVIEAGMDITCKYLITELAPIDSLIQRIGRNARFGGVGYTFIYTKGSARPYRKDIVEDTRSVLTKHFGKKRILDWALERKLVDDVLSKYFDEYINDKKLYYLNFSRGDSAYLKSDKSEMQKTVRNITSCQIAIHSNPESLKRNILNLERVNIYPAAFIDRFDDAKKKGIKNPFIGYKIVITDEIEEGYYLEDITIGEEYPFEANQYYVLQPYNVGYSSDLGLYTLDGVSQTQDFKVIKKDNTQFMSKVIYNKEPYWLHFKRSYECVYDMLKKERFFIEKISEKSGIPVRKLIYLLSFLFALHDLGKLTEKYQDYALSKENEFLAHFSSKKFINHPLQHAYISAVSIAPLLNQLNIPCAFYYSIINAIRYHHKVNNEEKGQRAGLKIQEYKFKDGYIEELERCINNLDNKHKKELYKIIGREIFNCQSYIKSESSKLIESDMIDTSDETILYVLYSFFSYILKVGDRNATKISLDDF